MIEALSRIESLILKSNGLVISAMAEDPEYPARSGCSFRLSGRNIKFREAKITPKKTGQFVTLWKRNQKGQTEPFNVMDDFDFYMIATRQEHRFGFFLFPRHILAETQILTTGDKEGKRGFRVYADWDIAPNRQAERTKTWQTRYFTDLTVLKTIDHKAFNSIINGY
ncbi:MepB family protein [Niabella drilacis]|uniref:MepB protein n=1 Tax=Niabella drilacis (strain DSM 25811 / CCM 8410 / CCUG 62505 / LMG 26954 / E90) TaxID=1285928 RepID=A0A1G6Y1S4_NIADE|nr:MepB family protein [Niabella drilacis]SDD83576.1 hypothetical protein SAMN04487894_11479 [Niabella drilacis]